MSTDGQKPQGALGRLYARQQPKVRANAKKAALLKSFAEEDYVRIAQLIKKWLDVDEKNKGKKRGA
ncbi:hypothetical protein P2G88_19320 [Aliiglaciecola sp. CAU 1673]|uniref:hypothetical protein n=1 Tax=Aliiglaciecola sp. CAU 1673 TaxID=3032595 RepID=UPI0023DABEB2|nr:hypothetical protein [Aliiglaciecola sp. CAU 1673]MDF2180415.1 hypothetical protein [Aliiglaciecola sp. CAU 1673]